jgi:hypothetical protein
VDVTAAVEYRLSSDNARVSEVEGAVPAWPPRLRSR